MQDSWRESIEEGKDLLSLGHQKTLSFSGDGGGGGGGGGGQLSWKSSGSLTENSNGGSSVMSPSDGGGEEKVSSENSGESGSTLKEHDYIGMAEVSSAASLTTQDTGTPLELNLKETDLCLGLGLGFSPSKKVEDSEKTLTFPFPQQDGLPKSVVDPPASSNSSTAKYAFLEAPADQRSSQTPWASAPIRPIAATENPNQSKILPARELQTPQICMPVQDFGTRSTNTFPGARVPPPPAFKNGVKRGYTEAMSDATRFNMAAAAMGDADVKALPKHPQNAYMPSWAPSKPTVPTPWHAVREQSAANSFSTNKSTPVPRVEKPGADCAAAAYKGSHEHSEAAHDSAINEAPPPKGQVVGWPPIRSYRKNTLAKPAEMFVKVNMDGVTVGRKVDLNAHSSYEGLLSALEEMFQPSNNAQGTQAAAGNSLNDNKHLRLLNGSDFVLTYEDKDGDWMLVGDVPWSMFTNTVRRLRITRGPDATGPGPRGSEKIK